MWKLFELVLLLTVSCFAAVAMGYRPVILMHGLTVSSVTMNTLKEMILAAHPGTPVHNIDAYNDEESFKPMWEQVHGVYSIIAPILNNSPDGVILIGHSQGGLIFRGILEYYPTQNITFIALASPLNGQYGEAEVSKMLPFITREFIYQFCYEGELAFSICHWWKDPFHSKLYRKHNRFLYALESPTDSTYKRNFARLEKLVLIGGPNDGIVEPWQSSHFSFYDKHMDIVDCVDQQFYADDSFGLRTLDESGRVHVITVPGVQHFEFHKKQSVFDCCIEQWLD